MGQRQIQLAGRFRCVSYGHSQMDAVVKYIQNQEEHHAKKTFKEEYLELLRKFNVQYNETYLFEWIEHNFLKRRK